MKNENASYLTVAEAADVLAVSRKTIYRLVWRGRLPARRVGRALRIPARAVLDGGAVRAVTSAAAGTVVPLGSGSRSGIGER